MRWIDPFVVHFLIVSVQLLSCDTYDLVLLFFWTISYSLILYYCLYVSLFLLAIVSYYGTTLL
jgi:hypothetical protein